MRFYWIQEESSGVLEFDKISSYPAGSAEESQSSANFNENPRILHADMVFLSVQILPILFLQSNKEAWGKL